MPGGRMRIAAEFHSGNYEEAAAQAQINQDDGGAEETPTLMLGRILYLMGREAEAAATTLAAYSSSPIYRAMLEQQPQIGEHLEAGKMKEAIQLAFVNIDCSSRGDSANLAAQWYATFGEEEKMFRCVEAAPRFTSYGLSIRFFDFRFKPVPCHAGLQAGSGLRGCSAE